MPIDLSAWIFIFSQRAYWRACFSMPRLSFRPNLGGAGFIGHTLTTWFIENNESMKHLRMIINTAHERTNVKVTTVYCAVVVVVLASYFLSRKPAVSLLGEPQHATPVVQSVRGIYADEDTVTTFFDAKATEDVQPYQSTYSPYLRMKDLKISARLLFLYA